jgi:hypothetical protein
VIKVICTGDSIVLYSPSPRGDIQWQISTDGTVWNDIESANSDTLGIKPESSVYYRTKITEGTCEPFYTEHIIVEVDNSVSIPKNTFIIDTLDWQNNFISMSDDKSVFTFNKAINAGNLFEPDDVFVTAKGEGVLRKVISVTSDGDNISVLTNQATMEDVFDNANLDFNIGISQNKSVNNTMKLKGTKINYIAKGVKAGSGGFTYDFSNTVIYQEGALTFSIKDGTIIFNPDYYFDIDFENRKLTKLEFKTENSNLSIDCNFLLNASGAVNLINHSDTLVDYDKTYLTFVGWVPVVVVINTKLVAKLDVNTSADFNIEKGFTNTYTLSLGAKYENEVWSGNYEMNPSFTVKPLTMGGIVNLNQKFIITPEVSIKFYGVAGPYCKPSITEEFNAAITSPSLDWDAWLKAHLDIKFGADIDIFGETIIDYSKTYSYTKPLWNAPDTVLIISGNNQTGSQGEPLAEAVKVKVTDNHGNAISNVPVYFEITQGAGSVDNTSILTSNEGFAEAQWTLGTSGESQALEAKVLKADGTQISGSPQFFNATSEPIASSIEILSGNNQTGTPGQELPNSIEVIVKDINGDPIEDITVNFSIIEGAVSTQQTSTNANGIASTIWTLGSTQGEQILTVTAFESDGSKQLLGSPLNFLATSICDANIMEGTWQFAVWLYEPYFVGEPDWGEPDDWTYTSIEGNTAAGANQYGHPIDCTIQGDNCIEFIGHWGVRTLYGTFVSSNVIQGYDDYGIHFQLSK